MSAPEEAYETILDETSQLLVRNEDATETLTIASLTNGHVLLEGIPGVAKTMIANLSAHIADLDYQRVQMTPGVLPADITGTHIYRENLGEFELQRGPVFPNVVLTDEVNRATPKTQSALLEAMEEEQMTIEDEMLKLPYPFIVVATQNPVEYEGTFNLPEAQRNRFQLKVVVDLPERADEWEILERFDRSPSLKPSDISNVIGDTDIGEARQVVTGVHVDDKVFDCILDLIGATRTHTAVDFSASPRASLAFLRAGKATATIHGRDYVTSGDVKRLAPIIMSHHLVLGTETGISGCDPRDVVEEVIDTAPISEVGLDESTTTSVTGDDD